MKHFFEVFFIAVAGVLLSLGNIGLGIFFAMFAVIAWMAPIRKVYSTAQYTPKSVPGYQALGTATVDPKSTVTVEYEFKSALGESFTASIHHYGALSHAAIEPKLMEYLLESTGIPVEPNRVHIKSIK